MHSRGLIILIGTLLIAADNPKEDSAKKDLERIQGTWKIVKLEANGEQAPAEIVAKLKLVFKDNKLTFTPGEPGFTNYTIKLDPSTKPASFDMTHADGKNKGKTQKGFTPWREIISKSVLGIPTSVPRSLRQRPSPSRPCMS